MVGFRALTQGYFWPVASEPKSRYAPRMPQEYVCSICEQPERRCQCTRYCCICQSLFEVRLCEDGVYYCAPCREACDMHAQYLSKE